MTLGWAGWPLPVGPIKGRLQFPACGPRSSSCSAPVFSAQPPWRDCFCKKARSQSCDAAGFFFVPSDPSSHLANELVKIGSLPVLLVGVGVILAVTISRDWVRSLACAVSPIVAVEVVEHIASPWSAGRWVRAVSPTRPGP